jgi:hypothetical protein
LRLSYAAHIDYAWLRVVYFTNVNCKNNDHRDTEGTEKRGRVRKREEERRGDLILIY